MSSFPRPDERTVRCETVKKKNCGSIARRLCWRLAWLKRKRTLCTKLLFAALSILVLFPWQVRRNVALALRAGASPAAVPPRVSFAPLTGSSDRRLACGYCDRSEAAFIQEMFATSACVEDCASVPGGADVVVVHMMEVARDERAALARIPELVTGEDAPSGRSGLQHGSAVRGGRILFVIADEYCSTPQYWDLWYWRYELVLRQYSCHDQYSGLYAQYRNVMAVPLGYGAGMLSSLLGSARTSAHATAAAARTLGQRRYYAWAFAGNTGARPSREEAARVFQNVGPHFMGQSALWAPPLSVLHPRRATAAIYSDANFVLSGRGMVSLECFRHYEASMHGAIPVVVGTVQELNSTFAHFGSWPPWVFAPDWESSKVEVVALLGDRQRLQERQIAVLDWWDQELTRIWRAVAAVYASAPQRS